MSNAHRSILDSQFSSRKKLTLIGTWLTIVVVSPFQMVQQAWGDLRSQEAVYSLSGDGAWTYSRSSIPQGESVSTTFYSTSPNPPDTYSQFRILPDARDSQLTGGDTWSGIGDEASYHVFTTYIQSKSNQTIPIGLNGDDGHSLFIDDQFVAGGGFADMLQYDLRLIAGQPRKLSLVGYNGPAGWSYTAGVPFLPTQNANPQFEFNLQTIPGIRLNSTGSFRDTAGSPQIDKLGQFLGFVSQPGNGIANASSFVTDNHAYTLDSVELAAHSFSTGAAELRIRYDQGGQPGLLIGSLGTQTINVGDSSNVTYESTGLTLAPNTRYWISVGERGSGDFQWGGTFEQSSTPSSWAIGSQQQYSADFGETWQPCCYGQSFEAGLFRVNAQQTTPFRFQGEASKSIQHQFYPGEPDFGIASAVTDRMVVDSLPISADFSQSNQFILNLSAPDGYQVVVDVPDNATGNMGIDLSWFAGPGTPSDQASLLSTTSIEYTDLVGSADFSYKYSNVSDNNGYVSIVGSGEFNGDLRFKGIAVTSTFENRQAIPIQYEIRDGSFSGMYFSFNGDADTGQFVRLERIGDFDHDDVINVNDINALTEAVRHGTDDLIFDLNGDHEVNQADRTYWIEQIAKTYFGDSSLNGEFDSGDFVLVFQAGEYEDLTVNNSEWSTGDWNGDGDFTSTDFVKAFQAGGYEQGPRPSSQAVPEPSPGPLIFAATIALAFLLRSSRN